MLARPCIHHYVHLGDTVEDHAGDAGKQSGDEQASSARDELAGKPHNQRCRPPRRHADNGQL